MGDMIKLFCLIGVMLFTFFNLLLATLYFNFISLMILDLNLVIGSCFIFFVDDAMEKMKKKRRKVS